jgi:large subunit ribosomal protein L24
MKKIKANDQVIVITGKDKGKVAKVLRVLGDRLMLEGVNLVKKHVRPNPNKNVEGGIITKEASIHVSNVAIYNSQTKKADRVGIKIAEDGKKSRFYKSNNEVIQ